MRSVDRQPHGPAAGFTLVELLISIAISSLVLSMAFQALLLTSGMLNQIEKSSQADDEAKQLNEYFSGLMMAVGGGLVRPWSAIWIEDNVLNGSDRFTMAELEDAEMQCTIESILNGRVTVDDSSGCCLTNGFKKRQVLLITGESDSRSHWESRYVESVDLSRCEARLGAGQSAALSLPPASSAAWVEGTIAVVRMRVLRLDTVNDQLVLDEDFDLDGDIDSRVVADRVIDLQGALGYDVSPWDWRIDDTAGTGDEWLYNATGDTLGLNNGQGLAGATREDLRMARVGVIVGAPARAFRTRQTLQLLNGPVRSRPGWVLRSFVSTVGLRNHDVMR